MENDVRTGNVARTNNELRISLKGEEIKVFLQDGFYQNSPMCDYMHIHSYTEIHLVTNGRIDFTVGGERMEVKEGVALIIPGGIYHGFSSQTDGAIHAAFQIDRAVDRSQTHVINDGVIRYLFEEISKTAPQGDHATISAIITMICTLLFSDTPLLARGITDTGYLINDFFTHNYREDIRLSDLAALLHLSERQTERLVKEQTGRYFRDELTATRMKMADQLLATTDMPLTLIAQYVGYHSYAGFWKARERYKKY